MLPDFPDSEVSGPMYQVKGVPVNPPAKREGSVQSSHEQGALPPLINVPDKAMRTSQKFEQVERQAPHCTGKKWRMK